MGLLDYADAARNKLAGLLGGMPLVQIAQGRAQMPTRDGLLGALRSIPVFDPVLGAEDAFNAGLNALTFAGAGAKAAQGAANVAGKADDIWYHGSPVDIYGSKDGWFRLSSGEAGVPVVWGVRDPFAAEGYARGEMSFAMDPKTGKFPLTKSWYPDMSGGGVYSLKSAASNPLEYDAGGKPWFKVPQGKILREAREAGHDAVIFKNIADNYSSSSGLTSDVIAWLNTKAMEMAPGE